MDINAPGPTLTTSTTTSSSDEIDPVIIWAPIFGVIGAFIIGFGIFFIVYFCRRRRTDQSDESFPNYDPYGPYATYETQVGSQETERASESSFNTVYEDAVYDEAT